MIVKKILIISPYYISEKNGLGDHTFFLAEELRKKVECDVLTSQKGASKGVIAFGAKWSGFRMLKILNIVGDYDAIVLQYVPNLYNPRGGINFWPPLLLFLLRIFTKVKISVYFHEINYPYLKTWKSLILYVFHRAQAVILSNSAHVNFVSTARFVTELSALSMRRILKIPVGSNIPVEKFDREKLEKLKHRLGLIAGESFVLLFGGFHPSKVFDWAYPTLSELALEKKFKIVHIGVKAEDVPAELLGTVRSCSQFIFTGHLDFGDISLLLQSGQMEISPFSDGASTRRGSLIAGIVHGTTVVTTQSEWTDEDILSQKNVVLTENNQAAFVRGLHQLDYSFVDKVQSSHDFTGPFCWSHVAEKILAALV